VSDTTAQKRKPFEQQSAFKESSLILKRQKRLSRYQKKAETEDTLNRLIPENTIPEVEGKPIKEHTTILKDEDGKIRVIKSETSREITYELKRNPNLHFLFNFSEGRVYFDRENCDYWLYVFSKDRKTIIRKVRLQRHDILNMLAFCITEIYGDRPLRQKEPKIWLSKLLKSKIQVMLDKLNMVFS